MRLRGRYLPLVALMGAFVAMLPAVASSETSPTVDAVNAGPYSHAWSPTKVTVGVGGVVTFRNATMVPHGVEWIGPRKPECSGVPVGTTAAAAGTEWSGTCSFAQSGGYTFYCTVHGAEMTGTITVSAGGTSTTTTTPGATGTTPTTSVPTAPVAPISGPPLLHAPSVVAGNGGSVVRGSLAISTAGAGDRLEVDLFASSASLGGARHGTRVRVGRLVRSSVAAGTVSFHVRLNSRARRALRSHRRLKLVVRITLTPPHGVSSSVTRTIVKHA